MTAEEAQTRYQTDMERLQAARTLLAVIVLRRGIEPKTSPVGTPTFERAVKLANTLYDEKWKIPQVLAITLHLVNAICGLWLRFGEDHEGPSAPLPQ